jgi:hypothetical protein
MIKRPKLRFVSTELSATAIEDIWLRRATAAATEAARDAVRAGMLPPMTPVGRLSDVEWGWIVTAVLFGWIKVRAEQATNSGIGIEQAIRSINVTPDPWDLGAIEGILPELADFDIDWNKPLRALSREEIVAFLSEAGTLISKAHVARDRGQGLVTERMPADVTEKAERPDASRYDIPADLSIPPFLDRIHELEGEGDRT